MQKWEYLEMTFSPQWGGESHIEAMPGEKVKLQELKERWANLWPTVTLEYVPYALEIVIPHAGLNAVFHDLCDYLGSLGWEAFSVIDRTEAVTLYFKRPLDK